MWPVLNDYFMTHLYAKDPSTLPTDAVSFAPTTYVVIILIDPLGAYLQKRVNLRNLTLIAILAETAALVLAAWAKTYW